MVRFGAVNAHTIVLVGRAADCDVVINDPTVSSRHLRVSWDGDHVLIEDLASANGTFVGKDRIHRAVVRPGDAVLIGAVQLPWTHPKLQEFLRVRGKGTVLLSKPPSFAGNVARSTARIVGVFVASAALLAAGLFITEPGRNFLQYLRLQHAVLTTKTDEEAYVRSTLAPQVRRAMDPTDPVVRNAAVQIAANSQGPFHVEQVAAIWTFLHDRWRYVNDPRGREYVASAKESIANNYAGDCDDFAVLMATMVRAIGGDTRVVIMEGDRGGHAYTEVCLREEPQVVANKLARYYGRQWQRVARDRQHIAYRSSTSCPLWLNLDWNATVPGGDYEPERWAVAINTDGSTEVLAVAAGTQASERAQRANTATAPRQLRAARP
jgi:pSer/pThr/pTyr-binding forkhead associated (FHA) protein